MEPYLLVEISRTVNDSNFSLDELFYRFFKQMPLVYFQAGASDIYDAPASIRELLNDEDLEEVPHKGPEELNEVLDEFLAHLKKSKVKNVNVEDPEQVTIAKYTNFENNTFFVYIILRKHNVIARLRVTPNTSETLTAVSFLGDTYKNPIWNTLVDGFGKKYIAPPKNRKDEINIITSSDGDFSLRSIPLVNSKRQEFSYNYYNTDFQDVSERIVATLQAHEDNGLVLLHGDPGTGKTSYLKYLLHTIIKKKLIYLPPDLIEQISSPAFVTFLMSQAANSILLIEDAENVLKHREAGGNQAVSNILNISDGILGDVLKLQIVCTFNSKLEFIDQALLRPGRLVAEYRFEKLEVERAAALMHKLHGVSIDFVNKPMNLAEIFNWNKMPNKTKKKNKPFGFTDNGEQDVE